MGKSHLLPYQPQGGIHPTIILLLELSLIRTVHRVLSPTSFTSELKWTC